MQLKEYYCKTDTLKVLGLTPAQFQKLGLKPVRYIPNPCGHPGWVHLYDRPHIDSLVNDPQVVSLRQIGRAPGVAQSSYQLS